MIPRLFQSTTVPHLIHPPAYSAFIENLRTINHEAAVPKPDKENPDRPVYEGELAHIYLNGPVIYKATRWERYFGAVDPIHITKAIWEAANNPVTKAIILHIDSPGGTVSGTPELAMAIDRVDRQIKPIVAHVDSLCASAAFWVASQCREIHANPSADVGSIGVYMAFLDFSQWINQDGIFVDVIKNSEGIHKAAGYPGTSLTDEQRAAFVEDVDEIFEQFTGAIQDSRGAIPAEAMTGRCYSVAKAIQHNLLDRVSTVEEAIESALQLVNQV